MFRFLLGIVFGVVLVPIAVIVWLETGNVPVAVSDQPLPFEAQITGSVLHARIDRQMVSIPPIQPDETNLVAGAHIYADKCSVCHGFYGRKSQFGDDMFPDAPPLWQKHHNGEVVGVSDDPAGETYWKVSNGIRLTGMPMFRTELSDTQIWQVSLLLANANKPLPPTALQILHGAPAPAPEAPPAAKQ
ncbi:MAG TPA: cytochrome c [Terracidiphilus sp.]|nr:cytochrome c [Terracidiphilus sp.]